ncbi:hypothetical protein NDU88_001716 [Pleurodeles waltl]|uniref:Uncharacterized protein n=1 Tax=Pleurodeles waltl TaxID=8319 RepID=A0AAV7MMI3_PLEWA|nr:hypothetical protein NDU88_001716 [Pleurodeles waltl]
MMERAMHDVIKCVDEPQLNYEEGSDECAMIRGKARRQWPVRYVQQRLQELVSCRSQVQKMEVYNGKGSSYAWGPVNIVGMPLACWQGCCDGVGWWTTRAVSGTIEEQGEKEQANDKDNKEIDKMGNEEKKYDTIHDVKNVNRKEMHKAKDEDIEENRKTYKLEAENQRTFGWREVKCFSCKAPDHIASSKMCAARNVICRKYGERGYFAKVIRTQSD